MGTGKGEGREREDGEKDEKKSYIIGYYPQSQQWVFRQAMGPTHCFSSLGYLSLIVFSSIYGLVTISQGYLQISATKELRSGDFV